MGVRTVQSWRLQPTLFSSWKRLTRIHACVNRFISNCKAAPHGCGVGELTPEEIREALQREKELPKSGKIVGLHPRLHDDGLVRPNRPLKYYHELSNHIAGTNQVLANMSSRLLIVSGWEKECSECNYEEMQREQLKL